MIIKVELIDQNGDSNCMMFGNDYKKWHQQLYEYLCKKNRKGIIYKRYGLLEQSWAKWAKEGLKWCSWDEFPGYYMEYNGKDARRVNFTIPSERTLVKFENILAEVAELNLAK